MVSEGIESRVRGWRREFVRAALLEGLVRCAVGLGGLALAGAVLDAAITLPLAVRWAFFAGFLAAAAGAAAFWLVLPVARATASSLLRAASRRYPDLAPYLLPAWELAGSSPPLGAPVLPEASAAYGPQAPRERSYSLPAARRGRSPSGLDPALGAEPGTSAALARAHLEQTQRLLEARAELPVFPARLSPGAKRGAVGFCACLGVFLPWLHGSSPGLGRLLAPWGEVPLESWIEVAPGDLRTVWDSPVTITARVRRAPLENGVGLWVQSKDAPWTRAPWDSEEGAVYSYRIASLNRTLRYRLQWRDQRGRVYALEPLPYPRLAGLKASARLPGRRRAEQAAQETSLETSGEVEALRGSWIVVHGRPTAPLSKAEIRVSYLSSPVELKPKPSGEVEGGFPLNADGSFHLELVSSDGVSDPHPVSYGLKATADEPPTVDLLSPAFEVEASPRDSLAVTYEAHDDYGLTSASLLYRRPGGPEKAVPVQRFAGAPTDFIGDYAWNLSDLRVGETVEFRLKVADNCVLGRQSGYSKTAVVRLMDFEGAHARMESRWLGAERDLKALVEQERAERRLLEEMRSAKSSDEAEGLRRQWERMDSEAASQWSKSADALEELSRSMAKDPYANPGVAEAAAAAASDVRDASKTELPRASQAAREGRLGDADRSHAGLEALARKAERMLSGDREVQGLQDLWSDAQRMEQAGSELSAALSDLSGNGGKPSAADRRKLEEALKSLQEQMSSLAKTIDSLPKPAPGGPEAGRRKTFVVPLRDAQEQADALQRALAAGDYAEAARIARRLAAELGKARRAIAEAARSAAQSGGGGDGGGGEQSEELSRKMEAALDHWREAVDAQTKSLGLAQKVDEDKTRSLLEAQKRLLGDLAARQGAALGRAAALGPAMPADARQWMALALQELSSKSISRAPDLLGSAARRLEAQAAADPAHGPGLSDLAREERGILDDLDKGAVLPAPSASESADAGTASAAQEGARGRTSALEGELRSLSEEAGALPGKALEPVTQAQAEQSGALEDLGRMEPASALKREQRALDLLEQGMNDMASAVERQKKIEAGYGQPFGTRGGARPGGARGRTGADTGFVELPSADSYQPMQDIRRDLERSLQEKRPQAYDRVIRDYFKRISQ